MSEDPPGKGSKRGRTLAALAFAAAVGAAAVPAIENVGSVLDAVHRLADRANVLAFGDLPTDASPVRVGVSDGGTSDRRQANEKESSQCVRPSPNKSLVPGSGRFNPSRQTAETSFRVTQDDEHAFCVTVRAGTSDKGRLAIIEGYLTAREVGAAGLFGRGS